MYRFGECSTVAVDNPPDRSPTIVGEVGIGSGLEADPAVILGYPSKRAAVGVLHLGKDACVRSGTVIYGGSQIGDRLATGHNVVIREECQIGSDVSIWSNSVIDYGCRIGNQVKVHANCYVAQYSVIDDGAFLAPGAKLANDLYPGSEISARLMRGPRIGASAQLGMNSTVLPYVSVGAGAIIGAGAVVTRDIPPAVIAVGNPAYVLGSVHEQGDIEALIGEHLSQTEISAREVNS